MYRPRRSHTSTLYVLALAGTLFGQASPATSVEWDADPGIAGAQGGTGLWDGISPVWYDGSNNTFWNNDGTVSAKFGGTAGRVSVEGSIEVAALTFLKEGYEIAIDADAPDRLTVSGELTGSPTILFINDLPYSGDSHPPLADIRTRGLHFGGGGTMTLSATLATEPASSQIMGVHDHTTLRFEGSLIANNGGQSPGLALTNGGRFLVAADAELDFIVPETFYTRQLWTTGDGTGVIEFDEGFVANQTENGTQGKGIGSLRLSNATVVTHHSQSIPLGFRMRSDGSLQANGHMVFEDAPGGAWSIRTNPQEYFGAIWIFQDTTIDTQVDFTHYGTNEPNSDYLAENGLSIVNTATLTKTGPATLMFAGDHAYKSGSILHIQEGSVVFQTDPSNAPLFSKQGVQGPTLNVEVATGARFVASAANIGIASLDSAGGTVEVHGELDLADPGGLSLDEASTLEIILGGLENPQSSGKISASGTAMIGGTLLIRKQAGFEPAIGTTFTILTSGSIDGSFTLEDRSGLGLTMQTLGDRVTLTTTQEVDIDGGSTILFEEFDTDLSQWKDLSTIPLWDHDNDGSRTNQSAFEITKDRIFRTGIIGQLDSAINDNRFDDPNGLRTFTALDYQFPQSIAHRDVEMVFDILCQLAETSVSGENGRFLVALNHDYPASGIDLTPEGQAGSKISDISNPEDAWFARPAYHLRLRASPTAPSFLQYGGGNSIEGEYEIGSNWWLPTFISGAGGVPPGLGEDFPSNSWVKTPGGITNTWRTYRWVMRPDRQELWVDSNGDGFFDDDELQASMPLPDSSPAPFYKYYENFEGLRLMWTSGQVFIERLKLISYDSVSPLADAGPDRTIIARTLSDIDVVFDASSSSDPDNSIVLYQWYLNGTLESVSSHARTVMTVPLGANIVTVVAVDETGVSNSDSANIYIATENQAPIADAGGSASITSSDGIDAAYTLDGSGSYDLDGNIVRYTWHEGNLLLGSSSEPTLTLDFGIGGHSITLEVEDNLGDTKTDSMILSVKMPIQGSPEVAYRENFARPGNADVLGISYVNWNLMQPNGEPVPEVQFDGNAHRCLRSAFNGSNQAKVNANPTGTEYEDSNFYGYLWMNQMPRTNLEPAEYLCWTDEYPIDREDLDIIDFSWVSAKEASGNPWGHTAPAVRINGQWYIQWDFRIQDRNFWEKKTFSFSSEGWVHFDPGPFFSATTAESVSLPDGLIEAFGFWTRKSYAFNNSFLDDFEIRTAERAPAFDFESFRTENFAPSELLDSSLSGPDGRADGTRFDNRTQFFMGLDPNLNDGTGLLEPDLADDGTFRIRYQRAKSAHGISGTLKWSTDLDTWSAEGLHETLISDSGDAWLIESEIDVAGRPTIFLTLEYSN
jgi:hypothetical protein